MSEPHEEAPADSTPTNPSPEPRPRAVVGIGGSAGALDGYERFFLGLPVGSGMAFVVAPHLSPQGESLMPDLLARCTSLPVQVIEDGALLEPDHVYVLPAGCGVSVMNGRLLLEALEPGRGHEVIDAFLTALAADQGERAVAVILSGMGSDGTRGARAVKENFGLVLAQDPASADYPSMPASVVRSGVADEVRPAEELAARLYQLVTHQPLLQADPEAASSADLQRVLLIVRARTGQDFTRYKPTTLLRRIDRRMKASRIRTLGQYARHLQEHPEEVDALFEDLTINVTSFFRDVEAFERLSEHLRTYLAARDRDEEPFRAWVVGCASGEEAYSVAMLLHELTGVPEGQTPMGFQVFATDIDPRSIERARLGWYPRSIEGQVTPERLARFFTRHGDGYQIDAVIRERVVFALHNTFNDPPFTRVDLLTCRNTLIYLGVDLQKHVLTVFHYALVPHGLLFLGASEAVGLGEDRFRLLDPRWKIYRRDLGVAGTLPVGQLQFTHHPARRTPPPGPRHERPTSDGATLAQHVQRLLLTRFVPPTVVVDPQGDILYVTGHTGRYLELPAGSNGPNNVLAMTRDGLRFELAAVISRVARERRVVTLRDVHHDIGGVRVVLDLTVQPIEHPGVTDALLIVFQERSAEGVVDGSGEDRPEQIDTVQALTREVQHLRDTLQATLEHGVISSEELRSTNEEYQTTIEELKSSNEELMTSKEELQSVNEELITTSAEHQRIIHDLAQANDDMKNLLESAGIATLFLGNDLRIKRFTPFIREVINLLPTDVGRHIGDINVRLHDTDFERTVTTVLETLLPIETQVRALDGHWHLMRISPYRTSDNFIDGVVAAFTNIDRVKTLETNLDRSELYSEALLNSIPLPMLVFDDELRLLSANRALYGLLRLNPQQSLGERLFELGSRQLDLWELREKLERMVLTDEALSQYVIDLDVPGPGVRKMKVEAWPIVSADGKTAVHLMTLEDITPIVEAVVQVGEAFSGDPTSLDD
ncbi:CheR family methyltransferase [Deinococcus pimensis]|uniref:CheR family methyltransferase n=1 Tax=Deinococcus pimensis TaxID=309888 RepID=UPI0004B902F4|nr:CheR family methyltransferase [Deinococcus pimensis]